jgi:hypothetical protein
VASLPIKQADAQVKPPTLPWHRLMNCKRHCRNAKSFTTQRSNLLLLFTHPIISGKSSITVRPKSPGRSHISRHRLDSCLHDKFSESSLNPIIGIPRTHRFQLG